MSLVPIYIHLGGERHYESKVSCPRTQQSDPSQGSNPDRSIRSLRSLTIRPPRLSETSNIPTFIIVISPKWHFRYSWPLLESSLLILSFDDILNSFCLSSYWIFSSLSLLQFWLLCMFISSLRALPFVRTGRQNRFIREQNSVVS